MSRPRLSERELRKQLHEAKAQAVGKQGKLDALATVTANLYAENLALKKPLGRRGMAVLHTEDHE
ncbi:hypothetical protein [Streptomyces sp. NPDC050388]|uniref:hypothetical protein n=1 Tax=Streptomyces sp. NPDC050388 TaxID=3155781 RepID=UPI00341BFFC9